jgi:hypothetical protein
VHAVEASCYGNCLRSRVDSNQIFGTSKEIYMRTIRLDIRCKGNTFPGLIEWPLFLERL